MFAVQPRLPLMAPIQARARRVRRPFHPSQDRGAYRLPRDVRDRLVPALTAFRNREAAFALATFIARFWSLPGRVVGSFLIDRRELADRPDLGLTEAQVRGAIRVLEEIGFLDRAMLPSGSRYKATEDGLRRKPILYAFGSEYAPAFIRANSRAAAARGEGFHKRRDISAQPARQPSTGRAEARPLKSPKNNSEAVRSLIMGDLRKCGFPPAAFEPHPPLENALEKLLLGIRHSRGA